MVIGQLADREEWRPIEGWPYEVSSLGNVRRSEQPGHSTTVGRVLKPSLADTGYFVVNLSRNGGERWRVCVHHLVAAAFIEKPPGATLVRHLDGSRTRNAATNLAWGTHLSNYADAVAHGTNCAGERHSQSKLTVDTARQAKLWLREGLSQREVARRLGVTGATISQIARGKTWRHVDG